MSDQAFDPACGDDESDSEEEEAPGRRHWTIDSDDLFEDPSEPMDWDPEGGQLAHGPGDFVISWELAQVLDDHPLTRLVDTWNGYPHRRSVDLAEMIRYEARTWGKHLMSVRRDPRFVQPDMRLITELFGIGDQAELESARSDLPRS